MKTYVPIILIALATSVLSFKIVNIKTTKTLPMLFFKEGSTDYTPLYDYYENTEKLKDTSATLFFIKDFLDNNKNIDLIITGHSDGCEINKHDTLLSYNRAKKVQMSLIQLGVSSDQLAVKALGSSKPYTNNEHKKRLAKEERKQLAKYDRRVSFIIVNK